MARDVLFLGSGGSVPQRFLFKASLAGEFNHYAIGIQHWYVFPFLDCGAWGSGALLISWEDLDSFVFVSSGSHSSGDSR